MGRPEPTYVRLLNMLNAIRQMSPINALSADEELLLDSLIVRWHEAQEVTVSDIMRDERYGSLTTAYRRIVALRDKGMVAFRVDAKDRRVKFVEPTDLTRAHIERIEECFSSLMPAH